MIPDLKEFEEGVREAVARYDEWFGQLDSRRKVKTSACDLECCNQDPVDAGDNLSQPFNFIIYF